MAGRKEEQAIDDVLETLYALDLQGYHLDAKLAKGEALKRIKRTLARLNTGKRKAIEDETQYRLERFEKFSHLKEQERSEVTRLAREKHLTLEEAYAMASRE